MAVLVLTEDSDAGRMISANNRLRQFDYLKDTFTLWQQGHGLEIQDRLILELNFYAVQYLSESPGIFRSITRRDVTVGKHTPPPYQEVDGWLQSFFKRTDSIMKDKAVGPTEAAAYILWRLNWIHPFVEGNGRTSRAASYYALCQKLNFWLPGRPTIPERIRAQKPKYCDILAECDATMDKNGDTDLKPMVVFLDQLLTEQFST